MKNTLFPALSHLPGRDDVDLDKDLGTNELRHNQQ
jgi:hypothetical protein